MDDFLRKLKKVVRIVLYGTAISQSDCRKAGPHQLPCNKRIYRRRKPAAFSVMIDRRKVKADKAKGNIFMQ